MGLGCISLMAHCIRSAALVSPYGRDAHSILQIKQDDFFTLLYVAV